MLIAIEFAVQAHDGQKRRYSKEPFVCHPIRVAEHLQSWGYGGPILEAAILHDVVEDTDVKHTTILSMFGPVVSDLVKELTNYGGSWEERKKNAIEHMGDMSYEAFMIKVSDRIDNIVSTTKEIQETQKWPFRKSNKDGHIWYAEAALDIAARRLSLESQAFKQFEYVVGSLKREIELLEINERGRKDE
jgi:(p)ppGpp synthase/HD superfamily hydrolase